MTGTKYITDEDPDYSDAELLRGFKTCLARISMLGQEYEMDLPGGGTQKVTQADIGMVKNLVDEWQAKVNLQTMSPIGTLYARMR